MNFSRGLESSMSLELLLTLKGLKNEEEDNL